MREHRDLTDLLQLVKINKVDVRNGAFKTLCLKYGTPALYRKIANDG